MHKLNCLKASYCMGLLKESKSTMIYTNLHQVLYVWPLTRKRSLRFAVLKRRAVRKLFISRSNGMGCRSNGLSYPFKNNQELFERLELSVPKKLGAVWVVLLVTPLTLSLNPFTPMSDQDRISPYSINTIFSRLVTRIKENIS